MTNVLKMKSLSAFAVWFLLIQYIHTDNLYDNYEKKDEERGYNRKPQIVGCKDISPSIKEESSLGTFVTKIKAHDSDIQDRIEYSFVVPSNERPKFKIDKFTGEIITNHIFDRDEPIREKEAYITVRATDNGRPALDDVCTFKVIIEDINDNPPVFDKSKYNEFMTEDKQVGKEVMRITATDLDDGDNSVVMYELLTNKGNHHKYFRIDPKSGVVYLEKPIDKKPGSTYTINIRAYNIYPDQTSQAETEVKIEIVESSKKAPAFINPPNDPFVLKENFNQFDRPIATLSAISNVPDKPDLIFELVTGRTEQTNNKKTFVLTQTNKNDASIYLGKALDYESITEYMLKVTIKNAYNLVSEHSLKIKIDDVNDNIPSFVEVDSGTVLETEPIGTQVMQIRAIDADATVPFNSIKFELADNQELFNIDSQTGVITTKRMFDREELESYNVKVVATDGAPSALYATGKPNVASQVFRIVIADKNDHPPKFTQETYITERVPEDSNLNTLVIEVRALDLDTASNIEYSIESGNINDAFKIEPTTGRITINKPLDYEEITEYNLRIKANDGLFSDHASVRINIADVNDCPPVFKEGDYKSQIQEESIHPMCLTNIEAYDPDIKDRNQNQHIKYEVSKKDQREFLTIDENGCLRNIKPLDRDEPNGQKYWQILISAIDQDGTGLSSTKIATIELIDINDNAPFLNMSMPVVWQENRVPGRIINLSAKDYDEKETNGGDHFEFEIDESASEDIKQKFNVEYGDQLTALTTFDREQQKEYFIPILIKDGGVPQRQNVSYLHVVIGDVNDNAMQSGTSSIFVYNYKGEAPNTEIGRVFVEDLDDWDLPDKDFQWKNQGQLHFDLDHNTGVITMLQGTREGIYTLEFEVTEQSDIIDHHTVDATVTITVKEIPEEAVDKSGSIRFYDITAEKFIEENPISPKERLRNVLAELYNTSKENVDIFTVLKNDADTSLLDVRFSAHGSPYYSPEKLNGKILQKLSSLEDQLGMKMLMVGIDECIIERAKCEDSCLNYLEKDSKPSSVFTNRTSFVGVNAYIIPVCSCEAPRSYKEPSCLNHGIAYDNNRCECKQGYDGPNCEQVSVGFHGNSWALYPRINPCDNTKISLEVRPATDNALVMYIGPMTYSSKLAVQDYLALEIVDGYPVLIVDYGTGSVKIQHNYTRLETGKFHLIDIVLSRTGVEMTVDNCKLSSCMSLAAPQGKNEFLNANSPISLGGASVNLEVIGHAYNWNHIPTTRGYIGCIRNLTINDQTYNLGQPSLSQNIDPGCEKSLTAAVTFGVANHFLWALLFCIIVLIILIFAVVIHKKTYSGVSFYISNFIFIFFDPCQFLKPSSLSIHLYLFTVARKRHG